MATENLEIEVIVNGKKAKVELDKVNKSIGETGDQAKESGNMLDGMFTKAKVGAVALLASFGALIAKGKAFSTATANLSKEMRAYTLEISSLTGMNAQMVAGFAQTGKSAGMTNTEIKEMVDTAIALGRAFPHESVESFVDNLTMLSTSGEAQGYIVDILEQKWGTIDLKLKTTAEKMQAVREATRGVNEQFEKASGSKVDLMFTKANNALIALGITSLNMIDKWGWLDAVNESLDGLVQKLTKVENMTLRQLESELQARKEALEVAKQEEAGFFRNDAVIKKSIRNKEIEVKYIEQKIRVLKEEAEQEKKTAEKTIAERTKVYEENAKREEELKQLEEDKKKAIAESEAQAKKTADTMSNFYAGSLDKMGTAITDFVIKGKADFKGMALSIVSELTKIRIAQSLAGFGGAGGIMGTIGSFFGFHTGTPEVKHTGGFISLPSHHSGSLRTDERLAKLQVGEAVINRAGTAKNKEAIKAMNAGGTVGGGGNVTTAEINFNVQAIDSASFNNYLVGNRQTIENIINNSLSTNGSVRRTIKQVV